LIAECFASLECRISDTWLVKAYNFFIFEVVKAHLVSSPKYPRTLHYRGGGIFQTSGGVVNKREKFTKWKGLPNF
jgi:flavin reductase (DIM6/NTAB) family NADH-FMN oxidoreductase RutF